jgi:hypothetical protein
MFCIPLFALAALALGAQTPATSNVRGAAYPQVHADRRVTFQLKAPTARTVEVMPGGGANGLGKGPFAMARSEEGVWTVTIGPVQPGFHYYWLLIDGVAANDPNSETFFGWGRQSSGIEVPDAAHDFYEPKDVPHGDVRMHYYRSKVTGAMRPDTMPIRGCVTRCSTCSMARAKASGAGRRRGGRTSFSTD